MRHLLFLGIAISLFLCSCSDDEEVDDIDKGIEKKTFFAECYNDKGEFITMGMIPVYSKDKPENDNFKFVGAKPYEELGSIYCYDNKILINEHREGIHIIDNTNPLNPVKKGFLNVDGSTQISIRNDVLYTNQGNNLLALDIEDLENVTLEQTIENVLSDWEWQNSGIIYNQEEGPSNYYGHYICPNRDSGEVLDWIYDTIVNPICFKYDEEFRDTSINYWCYDWFWLEDGLITTDANVQASADGGTGQGGSITRYTIASEHLYVINNSQLKTYDIKDGQEVENTDTERVTWGSETIFPLGDNLFIGTESGMYIFDKTTPSNPEYVSDYSHMVSCDPVVAKEDYAFVTLRSGTSCRFSGQTNQLDIIDISDLKNPEVIKVVEMDFPKGLGVDDDVLFVCDLDSVKVLDITNPIKPTQVNAFYIEGVKDVIPKDGHLIVVSETEFKQYDYRDVNDIKELSRTVLTH